MTIDCWSLIVDYLLLKIDHWLLIVDCWSLTIEYWLLILNCWSLIIDWNVISSFRCLNGLNFSNYVNQNSTLWTAAENLRHFFLFKRPSRSLLRKVLRFGSFRLHVCKVLVPKGSDLGSILGSIWTLGRIAIRGSAIGEKGWNSNVFFIYVL